MGALDGIKVLELSQFIAGPVCGAILADHGADVIKIEKPGGEDGRRIQPFVNGESLYFAMFNRNKSAITLDLSTDEARDIFLSLTANADVVIENFRPRVFEKWGLSYADLAALNPRLIVVSLSGFGQDGPYRDAPAFDQILQALSGLMYLNGQEGDPPMKLGISVADYAAAFNGAIGALLAIITRERTGHGQHVDVALYDSVVSLLETALAAYRCTGELPPRMGNGRLGSVPGNAYECRDGWIYIAGTSDALWKRLVEAMDTQLLWDERFQTNADRVLHRHEVDQRVGTWCGDKSVEEIHALLRGADVPCAPVRSVRDLLDDPQLATREMLVELDHHLLGRHTVPGVPIKLSLSPGEVKRPAPGIGEHNDEIFSRMLKFSSRDLARLRKTGIV